MKNAKILIIDDDPDIVESMKVVLEDRKYRIAVANSGEEGLKRIKLENPDLIILDVMMETGSKGFDVARKIRKDEKYKNVPILMLTALKERTGWDFTNEAGDKVWLPVNDYVDKPLKPEELLSKVEKLLKG